MSELPDFFNLADESIGRIAKMFSAYTIFYQESDEESLNEALSHVIPVLESFYIQAGIRKNTVKKQEMLDESSMYIYRLLCKQKYISDVYYLRRLLALSVKKSMSRKKDVQELHRNGVEVLYTLTRRYDKCFNYYKAEKVIQKANKLIWKQFKKDCDLRFDTPLFKEAALKAMKKALTHKPTRMNKPNKITVEQFKNILDIVKVDLRIYMRSIKKILNSEWLEGIYSAPEYSRSEYVYGNKYD